MPSAAEHPNLKIICYVTDGNSLAPDSTATERVETVLSRIRHAIRAGIDWVQIREKDLPARQLFRLNREAVRAASHSSGKARVIVNDRLDIALASGAAGVHLAGESLPVRDVVEWCRSGNAPADFLVGASCHGLQQAREAQGAGANYLFFGPVFDTPSKRPFGPPQGIAKLAQVCRAVNIPVIAIGGMSTTNAAECLAAGAVGIAAIRLFQEAVDPEELQNKIERIREALN